MNRFGTLMAWAQGFLNHSALAAIATFIASVIHDELDVAEKFVRSVIDGVTKEMADDTPGVALGSIITAAAAAAGKDGVKVGLNALTIAAANALDEIRGTIPTTQVDASGAMASVDAEADAAIAKINADRDARKKVLDKAAADASAALAARVSN